VFILLIRQYYTRILLSERTTTESLSSLSEIVVLYLIRDNQPVSGYQIRKRFMETTNKKLSFGTLVPMLQRFERFGLAFRTIEKNEEAISYCWHLTPFGIRQLESRLALLVKILRLSVVRRGSGLPALKMEDVKEEERVLKLTAPTPKPDFSW
jgi:DNA-binding PadR family transcriptional regulator